MADKEKRQEDRSTNIWISGEQKALFRWNKKSIFHKYLRSISWWKNEKLQTQAFSVLKKQYHNNISKGFNLTFWNPVVNIFATD